MRWEPTKICERSRRTEMSSTTVWRILKVKPKKLPTKYKWSRPLITKKQRLEFGLQFSVKVEKSLPVCYSASSPMFVSLTTIPRTELHCGAVAVWSCVLTREKLLEEDLKHLVNNCYQPHTLVNRFMTKYQSRINQTFKESMMILAMTFYSMYKIQPVVCVMAIFTVAFLCTIFVYPGVLKWSYLGLYWSNFLTVLIIHKKIFYSWCQYKYEA